MVEVVTGRYGEALERIAALEAQAAAYVETIRDQSRKIDELCEKLDSAQAGRHDAVQHHANANATRWRAEASLRRFEASHYRVVDTLVRLIASQAIEG